LTGGRSRHEGQAYSDEPIIGILKAHEAGAKVADPVRKHGISEQFLPLEVDVWRHGGQ